MKTHTNWADQTQRIWLVAIVTIFTAAHLPNLRAACAEGVTQGTNYGPETITGGSCPSVTNTPSVSPTTLCAELGVAPTLPTTITPPVYGEGKKLRSVSFNCHPPDNYTQTNPVAPYSVGTPFWSPPLPTVVTSSFNSTAYVLVTSSDTNCPYSNNVAIGTAYWVVSCNFSFYSTNCTAASLSLTNLTVTTNGCPNSGFSASAGHATSNAIQIITSNFTNACGNVDTNCPASKVTNSISPIVVTNWWTISGVGSTPPSGSGLSASFTPTNGGDGTITFYTQWKNGCTTNVSQTSSATNFHVGNCPCTTPIPDSEWNPLVAAFPKLVRCHTCKLANETLKGGSTYPHTGVAYNCLAWVIGDTSRWLWPEADANHNGTITPAEMADFTWFSGAGAGTVVFYGPSSGNVQHVALRSGGGGPDCAASSKLGEGIALSHQLSELEGGTAGYGNIIGGN